MSKKSHSSPRVPGKEPRSVVCPGRESSVQQPCGSQPDVRDLCVPQGWKLVPVVPTEEMLGAQRDALSTWLSELGEDADIYSATISATPQAPGGGRKPLTSADLARAWEDGYGDALRDAELGIAPRVQRITAPDGGEKGARNDS